MALALLRRYWIAIPIVALVCAVLWLRGSLAEANADAQAAEARVDELTKANLTLSRTIDMVARQRADNDAIAAEVAGRLGDHQTREIETRTIIEKAVQNDPEAHDWATVPVPDSVREALRTSTVDPGAP